MQSEAWLKSSEQYVLAFINRKFHDGTGWGHHWTKETASQKPRSRQCQRKIGTGSTSGRWNHSLGHSRKPWSTWTNLCRTSLHGLQGYNLVNPPRTKIREDSQQLRVVISGTGERGTHYNASAWRLWTCIDRVHRNPITPGGTSTDARGASSKDRGNEECK